MLWLLLLLGCCNGNAKSQPETVIEHLVGRQGQPSGAQVHAMNLSDRKGWSQNSPLPRPHLRVGSGGKGILLEIPAYWRPSKRKQFFFLCFCIHSFCIWAWFSFAVSYGCATLLLLLYFLSLYSITGILDKVSIFHSNGTSNE